MCRLLLVEDGADVEAVIRDNDADHSLVYHLVDHLSLPSSSSSSAASQFSISIGQLFVTFYRLLGGEKCFIYSGEDTITILKMAQMKLGGEAEEIDTNVFVNEMGNRFIDRLQSIRLFHNNVDPSSSSSSSSFDAVSEFYDSFLAHCKCGDSLEVLDFVSTALKEEDAVSPTNNSLANVIIVVEMTTLTSLLSSSSSFINVAASILLGKSSDISLCKEIESSSLSKEEAFSLLLTRMAKLREEKVSLSKNPDNASAATPRRKNAASTPGRKAVFATPVCATKNAIGYNSPGAAETQRILSTPGRLLSQGRTKSVSPLPPLLYSPMSSTETHSRQVILSYLRLVLNSRDELALARCIDTPKRGLDQSAFTDLRHEAESKGLPMFQCASSFVIRLRLGGKSYQAGEESKIRAHAKGLGELVDLIQKCQNVLEEGDKDAVKSLQKVINMLRSSIVKARDNRLRVTSVEKAAKTIRELIPFQWTRLGLIKGYESRHLLSGLIYNKKKIGTQGSKTKEFLRFLLDEENGAALSNKDETNGVILSDAYSSSATPVRFPSLWSQFQSPSADDDSLVNNSNSSFASPSLSRRQPNNNKNNNTSNIPLSPLCLNGFRGKKRTPIALKSTFTWATSDSPPCVIPGTDLPTLSKRLEEEGDIGGGGKDETEEADPNFVATQDAVGPTLVMRAKRKRKLNDLFDDMTDDYVGCRVKIDKKLEKVIEDHENDDTDGQSNSLSEIASDSTEPKKGNRAKKSKIAEKSGPAKKGTKVDPKKPKVRRKIFPQLSGQRTLSGFFK